MRILGYRLNKNAGWKHQTRIKSPKRPEKTPIRRRAHKSGLNGRTFGILRTVSNVLKIKLDVCPLIAIFGVPSRHFFVVVLFVLVVCSRAFSDVSVLAGIIVLGRVGFGGGGVIICKMQFSDKNSMCINYDGNMFTLCASKKVM